jgi:hypothetical protein
MRRRAKLGFDPDQRPKNRPAGQQGALQETAVRRPSATPVSIQHPRSGLSLISLMAGASAAMSGVLAWQHAIDCSPICGAEAAPCVWRLAALGLALLALGAAACRKVCLTPLRATETQAAPRPSAATWARVAQRVDRRAGEP